MEYSRPCPPDTYIELRGREPGDVKLLYCGSQRCAPGHSYGPDMRDHYVFHLIFSGNGTFKSGGMIFHLSRGQGFMLYPETQVYYSADIETPWEYAWVGFSGCSAGKLVGSGALSPDLPVVSFTERFDKQKELLCRLIETVEGGSIEDMLEGNGLFLEFLSNLVREKLPGGGLTPMHSGSQPRLYIERAKDYIRENLSRDITASDVADHLGLNRSYFSKIFTQACGKPPSQFITWYRLSTAWHLLHYTNMPIAEIAEQVGYNDAAYFSRRFTEYFGKPPREERGKG